jgi:hypothetical protein
MTIKKVLTYNGVDAKPSKEYPSKSWIQLAKEMDQWKSLVHKHQIDQMELKRKEGLHSLQERQVPNQNPFLPPSTIRTQDPSHPHSKEINIPKSITPNGLKIPFWKPTPLNILSLEMPRQLAAYITPGCAAGRLLDLEVQNCQKSEPT